MGWIVYTLAVLACSALIGGHLGRFTEAYTEMTGMMAGMTMGMLNGFVLGFAAAAATNSMVWGNLFGILLGLVLGLYFGRAGGLMGVMDGAMGGVMGGSMGAMLAIMVRFPPEGLPWTAALLTAIYLAGMAGLVVLIERSAPEHAALHRLAPLFTRAVAAEAAAVQAAERAVTGEEPINYYELLDIPVKATTAQVAAAYSAYSAAADEHSQALADEALATLSHPQVRADYDRALARAAGRDECCPPPRRSRAAAAVPASTAEGAPEPAAAPPRRLVDYYAFLAVHPRATEDEIVEAYLVKVDGADEATVARADRALALLQDPAARAAYDHALAANRAALTGAAHNGNGHSAGVSIAAAQAPALAVTGGRGGQPATNGQAASSTTATPRRNDRGQGGPLAGAAHGAGAGRGSGSSGAAPIAVRPARSPTPAPRAPRGGDARNPARRVSAPAVQEPAVVNITWRWALVGIPILALVVAGMLLSRPAPGATLNGYTGGGGLYAGPNPAAGAVAATLGSDGVQTVNILLNGDTFQYEPKAVKLKQGVPARFNLSVKGEPG